jgi:diketogulonate reductase-like aldo/keto reductase
MQFPRCSQNICSHLDCAWFYQNEGEIGDAIHDFLKENPNVKREDIFVTTKVWNHLHEPDEVKWSFEDSLKKLRLDYVDAYLIHWPIAAEKDTATMQPKIGPDGKVSSAVHLSWLSSPSKIPKMSHIVGSKLY